MNVKLYLDGALVDAGHAHVDVSNPAFLHGVGLFETLRTYDGQPFRLDAHVERLRRSAEQLNMPVGEAVGRVSDAVAQVLEANKLQNARVRITVTPPSGPEDSNDATLLVAAHETAGYPAELYDQGMTVFICSAFRQSASDPLAGHKTTSYFSRLLALRDAHERGCGEAIWFTPENHLAEGCISNVFVVKNGRLHTPALATPVLPGVTRAAVLELAAEQSVEVDESPLTIDNLLDADEVFLTNAVMEVMPAVRVERKPIGNEKPGPLTRQLAQAYAALVRPVS